MNNTLIPSRRRSWLAVGLAFVAVFTALVAWSQQSRADSSTTQVPMYIEVVAVPNGIAYWNPVKQKLYVYSADFRTCTGIYQMAKLGQPMTRTGQ